MPSVHGAVVRHGGIERSEGAPELTDAPEVFDNALLLRLVLCKHVGEAASEELHFHGKNWVAMLHTLQPDDIITAEGASPPEADEADWHVEANNADVVVHIQRGDQHAVFNGSDVIAGVALAPEWLQLPPTRPRKEGGIYKYINCLCALRDGIEVNLYAVVMENAKPGPASFGRSAGANFLVIDKSQQSLPCSEWTSSKDIPQFSVQILIQDVRPVELPWLRVGDVIRCHRMRVFAKPPHYINIRQQRYSSVIVFRNIATDKPDLPAASSGTVPAVEYFPVTSGTHTVTDAGRAQVAALQSWVRSRLSKETLSKYLTTIDELRDSDAHRDVIVKVLSVKTVERILVVADGSARLATHVAATEPEAAAAWLFSHVKVGMWLKLRNVSPGDDEDADLVVSAGYITCLPPWCFDVRIRRAALAAQPPVDEDGHVLETESPPPHEVAVMGTAFADTELDTEEVDERVTEVPAPQPSTGVDKSASSAAPVLMSSEPTNTSACNSPARSIRIASAIDMQRDATPAKSPGSGCSGGPTRATHVNAASGDVSHGESHAAEPAPTGVAEIQSLSEVASREDHISQPDIFRPGDKVVLFGIKKHPELNQLPGKLISAYKQDGSKWLVEVEGQEENLAIRASNLRRAASPQTHVESSSSVGAARTNWKARLTTAYDSQQVTRITELSNAFAAGLPSVVLGGFYVERILTSAASTSGPAPLLCAHCHICDASFPWRSGEENAAKRRRHTLPCGHWLFYLAFEFELEIRDLSQPTSTVEVFIRDQHGSFFGITPQAAASSAVEMERVRQSLEALLAYDGQANTMAVKIARYPRNALVMCDTHVV
jgi:hypothetical protein